MPRVSNSLTVLGMIGLLGAAASALGAVPGHFPENQRTIDSPDKKYSIYNKDSDQEPNHSLYIRRHAPEAQQKILDYGRHVDVMWSPESNAFFVNDYSGSSEATCLVFFADGLRRLDVKDLLSKIHEEEILSSDHLYVTCKKWTKERIEVSVSGRGDKYPNGFDRKFILNPRKQELRQVG